MKRSDFRRHRSQLTIAATAAVVVGLALVVPGTAAADQGSGGTSSVPVEFHVVTSNHSGLPCLALPTDEHVTVRGHLTGPSSQLERGRVDGTLYSHGDGYDESFWRYHKDKSYDYSDDMADHGHVSVTIDRLGYGDSDKPNGNGVCFGTEADVLHQIIGQLRDGSYSGDHTPRFNKIGLVGHSASGFIVEQEAAAFHDIDALGVLSSGEPNATPLVLERAGEQQLRCVPSLPGLLGIGGGGASNGYAPLEADAQQFRSDHLYNVEPAIADDLTAHRTDDACAGSRNAAQALAGDAVRNSLITVPVLVMAGAEDALFPHPGLQALTYTQSRKVTTHEIPDTGHAIAFSRNAAQFRDNMNHWLNENDL
jgi:pimeloyl-ACP methyl ester carboxylesterase